MIIKCVSRKSNVDQLIRYVLTEEKLAPTNASSKRHFYVPGVHLTKTDLKHLESERMDARLLAEFKAFKGTLKEFVEHCISKNSLFEKQNKQVPLVIKNNMRARSIKGYIREFDANEKFRLYTRKDSVKAYHTILSFSQLDSKHLNNAVLKDIAEHFITLRAQHSLVVGAVHRDKDHTHIHLIQSGVQYCTGLSNRITRQQFQELKLAMQEYQMQKYPQLIHSMPEHGKSKKGKTTENGPEKNIKRNERTFDKNILLGLLETTYAKSTSGEHFLTQLQDQGHVPYFRNGRLQGIKFEGDRKFRLNRLGYDEKKLQELEIKKEKEEKSLQELKTLRKGYNKELMQKDENLKSLSFANAARDMSNGDKRKELQELVNQNRACEEKHNSPCTSPSSDKEEAGLQELREIREGQSKDMDKSVAHDSGGREMTDDIDNPDDDRNYTDSKPNDENDSEDNDEAESNREPDLESEDDIER